MTWVEEGVVRVFEEEGVSRREEEERGGAFWSKDVENGRKVDSVRI